MNNCVDFGWYPEPLDEGVGPITLATLPDIETAVSSVRDDPGVDGDWIYAPLARTHVMGHGVVERPFPSRVFGMPKTHRLCHVAAHDREHLEFLVWGLSFFVGMRLTTTDAGFLDATTVRPRKLVDFVLNQQETIQALGLAESFWQTNRREPLHARRWIAALHALYIAQAPQALQFEQFLYLYGALDTCFKLATDLHSPQTRRLPHHSRTRWLCDHFQIPLPTWADDSTGAPQIAKIRNTTIHESLFVDAPLGFAVHGRGTNQNLPLEMKALVCRLLVALLGAPDSDYVRSRLDTRQMHRWTPS